MLFGFKFTVNIICLNSCNVFCILNVLWAPRKICQTLIGFTFIK